MPTPPPSPLAKRAAPLYGLNPDALTRLGAFESEVLQASTPNGEIILKIVDVTHRSEDQVQAEMDWLLALRERDLPVAQPIPSLTGRWTEPLDVEGTHAATAVAFRKCPGEHRGYDAWSDEHARKLGALLGHLHAHTRSWTPPGPTRPDWRDVDVLDRVATAFRDDPAMQDAVARLLPHADALNGRLTDVGLIHADAHAWNVLIDDHDTLTLIDFDDAVCAPYLHDLAIALYYPVATRLNEPADRTAERFLGPFLDGFDQVAPRPHGTSEDVATLLAMRIADLAIAVHLTVPPGEWTDELRVTATRLRDRTVAQHELVPLTTLRTFFD